MCSRGANMGYSILLLSLVKHVDYLLSRNSAILTPLYIVCIGNQTQNVIKSRQIM